jgi:hypothetical protein
VFVWNDDYCGDGSFQSLSYSYFECRNGLPRLGGGASAGMGGTARAS